MSDIKFIYFEGCPNAQKVRDSLIELKIEFDSIEQNSLDSDDTFKNYSSPSILKSDELVYGSEANRGGCSLGIPDLEEFKKLLK